MTTDVPLRGGDTLVFGDIELGVIHLVGHTPGSIALLYDDPEGAPHLFTGDSLFPGGVGRTTGPESFMSLYGDVVSKLFDVLPDEPGSTRVTASTPSSARNARTWRSGASEAGEVCVVQSPGKVHTVRPPRGEGSTGADSGETAAPDDAPPPPRVGRSSCWRAPAAESESGCVSSEALGRLSSTCNSRSRGAGGRKAGPALRTPRPASRGSPGGACRCLRDGADAVQQSPLGMTGRGRHRPAPPVSRSWPATLAKYASSLWPVRPANVTSLRMSVQYATTPEPSGMAAMLL